MMDVEVEPLFRPGPSLIMKARFICNIGDELSLWDVGSELRIYGENGFGIWLESEEKVREHIVRASTYTNDKTAPAVARNAEAVLVYMRMMQGAMLEETRSGVG